MNMFKNRRKAKEQADAFDALTGGESPPTTYKTAKSLRRKNKTAVEEPKPVFDLSAALPEVKELRTSLLMPNLSARFSMLREQDDPNTKVGKASDDSVLFPKRVSKMNLFQHSALADVAEVESIYSFRPPFADRERSDSVGDGYESDGGSVMSRARPGEGNNLFGGRQKLYRIATSSSRNLADADGTIAGRHVYEGDVSLSLFQQYRMREKERRPSGDENRLSAPATDTADSEIPSPATAFSKNRGTQSSTNSIGRRTSTAATSVVSDSPILRHSETDMAFTKPSCDNSTNSDMSARSMLPAVTGIKDESSLPTRLLSQSKSSSVLAERFHRPGALSANRKISSPVGMPSPQPLDFGFKSDSRSNSAAGRQMRDSPTPNQFPENDEILANNIQPNDRGKATAMGLFNKPAREFDEQQFSQRQKQIHDGALSSMSNYSRSGSRASDDTQKDRQGSYSGVASPSPIPDERMSNPRIPPIPDTPSSPIPGSHRASRASMGRSTPPRARSKSSASATAAANVKARVDSLIRKQNAELAALEAEKLGRPDEKATEDPSENKENRNESNENDDDDKSSYEESTEADNSRVTSSQLEVDESHIHPAFRSSQIDPDGHSRKSHYSNFSRTKSVFDDENKLQIPSLDFEPSNQPRVGLSDFISHLRQVSDGSFIMPALGQSFPVSIIEPSRASSNLSGIDIPPNDTSIVDSMGNNNRASITPSPNTAMSQAAQQFLSHAQALTEMDPPITPTTAMSQTAQRFLSNAMAHKDAAAREQTEEPVENDLVQQAELQPAHRRGESSETTKERIAFDEDLAERRRRIREGLKSVTERDRSQSPATIARGQSVAMQAFVQQRAVADPQPKAMKTLGLQNTNGQSVFGEEERGRNQNSGERRGRAPEIEAKAKKNEPTYARFGSESRDRHSSPRSSTPPGGRFNRARSNSNVADRSKSRPRQREPSNPPLPNGFPVLHREPPAVGDVRTRDRSGSLGIRNGPPGARSPPPDLNTGFLTRPSPRPSPISPQSPYNASTDPAQQSPGPQANGRTTPGSGRGTPTGTFNRKRSVTKTMISEPTFVSSTSSVPLVQLGQAANMQNTAPPLPLMNPKRRGTASNDRPTLNLLNPAFSRSGPLETVPASPIVVDFDNLSEADGRDSPSPRKLRKANSEGGSIAAKARQQALAAEFAKERNGSPALPMFPNRSATTLDIKIEGGMF